jgi:glycine/D-amino acid oxidase-like deaminating enzyme
VFADFLVLGGGIAGASAGYFLAESGRVMLLERESALGYHSTGRSAALFSEYYGGGVVRALTAASRAFFTGPPPGFDGPLLTPRSVLALCPAGSEDRFEAVLAEGLTAPVPVREIGAGEVRRYCPIVRPDYYSRAMLKPAAMDIDVDALHQGFARGIRARGGQVVTSAPVRELSRRGGLWHAVTGAGEFRAPVVVNAAGAWADEVAAMAGVPRTGLAALRRTAAIVDPPELPPPPEAARTVPGAAAEPGAAVARWPMVADVTETFYFKPESGGLLISPVDATPVPPGDARPDDLDVAVAAARVQACTTLVIRRIRSAWAGLRCSVPDGTPVIGEAPGAPGFFWLAALGGYGIQTAPAAGRLAAALAASGGVPGCLPPEVTLASLAPGRCQPAGSPAA